MSVLGTIVIACDRIDRVTSACGRTDSVHLELVVKTCTPGECRAVAATLREAGLPILLGHSRMQEARVTTEAVHEVPGVRTRLIGPLQPDKTNHTLACVDTIESLDSLALAPKIDARTTGTLPMFIGVNISGEAMKHSYAPADVNVLVDAVGASAHSQPVDSMTVGLNSPVEAGVRVAYAQPRGVRNEAATHLGINESDLALSTGVSRDLEWVTAEGAIVMHLGIAIFGTCRV